jgi:hypothetical protein
MKHNNGKPGLWLLTLLGVDMQKNEEGEPDDETSY